MKKKKYSRRKFLKDASSATAAGIFCITQQKKVERVRDRVIKPPIQKHYPVIKELPGRPQNAVTPVLACLEIKINFMEGLITYAAVKNEGDTVSYNAVLDTYVAAWDAPEGTPLNGLKLVKRRVISLTPAESRDVLLVRIPLAEIVDDEITFVAPQGQLVTVIYDVLYDPLKTHTIDSSSLQLAKKVYWRP